MADDTSSTTLMSDIDVFQMFLQKNINYLFSGYKIKIKSVNSLMSTMCSIHQCIINGFVLLNTHILALLKLKMNTII